MGEEVKYIRFLQSKMKIPKDFNKKGFRDTRKSYKLEAEFNYLSFEGYQNDPLMFGFTDQPGNYIG